MKVYLHDDEFMLYVMALEPQWRGQPAREISEEDYKKHEQAWQELWDWQKRIEELPPAPKDGT